MNIILLTPGTGSYHCGVCMRDNALAKELIRQGHRAVLVPMYLPLTLDESHASPKAPIFFGGISTWLREKIPGMGPMPHWMRRVLSAQWLLKRVAGKAAKTGGPEVAGMTISMLRGEQGNQSAELNELIRWLQGAFDGKKPDVIWLSTALQAGLARELKKKLGVPVFGFLQGEDSFLDGLGAKAPEVWRLLSERMRDADGWISPSRYFANLMADRLRWSEATREEFIRVVPNGVSLAEHPVDDGFLRPDIPTIGYLARFIPQKGLGLLVEAFIRLKRRMPEARLRCAGSMTNGDANYLEFLQAKLRLAGAGQDVEWLPNITLHEKIRFLRSISVFCVPATHSEAFGQYVIEALAAGTPVVLPRASAFPEMIEGMECGALFELGRSESESADRLAEELETMLRDTEGSRRAGFHGRAAVERHYSMTQFAATLAELTSSFSAVGVAR